MHQILYIVVVSKKMANKGTGTIRKHVLVEIGMVLIEEVCHCREGLGSLIYAQATSTETIQFLLTFVENERMLNYSTTSAYMLTCFLP